jgi:2'-5' RNA ligase
MGAMQTTSHFIGIALDSSKFTDLFVDLQKYFRSHDLEGAVEFQNILSLHITLYYLEASLTEDEKSQLLQGASDISSDRALSISELKGSYFGEPGKERVCYIGCAENEKFKEINQFFAKKYGYAQIPENQLAFVPHISLFRIHNPEAYTPHKAEIDTLVSKAVQTIAQSSLIQAVHLFQVSSLFCPEVQIAI